MIQRKRLKAYGEWFVWLLLVWLGRSVSVFPQCVFFSVRSVSFILCHPVRWPPAVSVVCG